MSLNQIIRLLLSRLNARTAPVVLFLVAVLMVGNYFLERKNSPSTSVGQIAPPHSSLPQELSQQRGAPDSRPARRPDSISQEIPNPASSAKSASFPTADATSAPSRSPGQASAIPDTSQKYRTAAKGSKLTGRAISVADGDTLSFVATDGSSYRVRVYGVDSPELHQSGGEAAQIFSAALTRNRDLELTVMDTDSYQRTVAIVTLPDGRILNAELIRAGHAWVYKRHCITPQCKDWLALEAGARKARRGLWQEENPEPPRNWRKEHPRR